MISFLPPPGGAWEGPLQELSSEGSFVDPSQGPLRQEGPRRQRPEAAPSGGALTAGGLPSEAGKEPADLQMWRMLHSTANTCCQFVVCWRNFLSAGRVCPGGERGQAFREGQLGPRQGQRTIGGRLGHEAEPLGTSPHPVTPPTGSSEQVAERGPSCGTTGQGVGRNPGRGSPQSCASQVVPTYDRVLPALSLGPVGPSGRLSFRRCSGVKYKRSGSEPWV